MAHENVLTDDARIAAILRQARRVAVLGIKPESRAGEAGHYVPAFLARQGVEVIPVPTYYPEVNEILGRPVVRHLASVPGPVDVLDVFRRPADIPAHLEDVKSLRPRLVWFQLGIRNDDAAEELARAGIPVVQDRCLMAEWRRLVG
ncbi:MAG TPA: CoA-binding protein [Anaeromyxobacteraceae bacterium]|nr:CoA-binding protein [Anaeromyxobacteraceae bacterium]